MAMSRKEMLRRWMLEWDLTYSDFAKRLGVSVSGAFHLLNRDSIPKERHAALLAWESGSPFASRHEEKGKEGHFPLRSA